MASTKSKSKSHARPAAALPKPQPAAVATADSTHEHAHELELASRSQSSDDQSEDEESANSLESDQDEDSNEGESESDELDSRASRKRRKISPISDDDEDEDEENVEQAEEHIQSVIAAPSRIKSRTAPSSVPSNEPSTGLNPDTVVDHNTSFASLSVKPWLVNSLNNMAIKRPTGIQKGCIPEILRGRDCIGGSRTGSGKTVAFAVPILQKWAEDPFGIFALVLTATRYLQLQTILLWIMIAKSFFIL